jgi:XTP/dITP diphosphohydrolase
MKSVISAIQPENKLMSEKLHTPAAEAFLRLLQIMDELREKCPWDRKQTISSLRMLTQEEVFELSDAIISEDWKGLKEESGDLFLHLVFYAKIASEQGQFEVADVLNAVCDKLISRHPHVYGDWVVKDEEEVKRNWEQLKLKEGKKSALEGVPSSAPALLRALRIQEKSAKVGFEWEETEQVMEKLREEVGELEQAVQTGNLEEIRAEFGDVLFSFINYARFLGVDPEEALELTNRKFVQRFTDMEMMAAAMNRRLADMSLVEKDALWNQAKQKRAHG